MKFVTQVRKGQIAGPVRRNYAPDTWLEKCEQLAEDAHDRALGDAGELVHAKAAAIRAQLQFVDSAHTATTKVRAFVAMSNWFVAHTADRMTELLSGDRKSATQFEFLNLKLPLLAGHYSPDEIMQGVVDGCEVNLRIVLATEESLAGVPKFAAVDWSAVWADVHLGILYRHLEDLWDDCLWNGYEPRQDAEDGRVRFVATEPEWPKRWAASIMRFKNLATGRLLLINNLVARQLLPGAQRFAALRKVKALKKEGRRQRLVFASGGPSNEAAAVTRLFVWDTTFKELLHEAHGVLAGATLDHLLQGWIILHQTAELMRPTVVTADTPEREDHAWLPEFAPLLEHAALTKAFMAELSITRAQAEAMREFLTYRGKVGQELWAQPLIPVSNDAATPMFGALTAEPARLVDVWLRQLDVDLGRRGPAFEQDVRSQIRQLIQTSRLAPICAALDTSFVLSATSQHQKEEIDLLIVVGDAVIVGELKCILRPTEAKGAAEHRQVLIGAATQVQRKVAAAASDPAVFRQHVLDRGLHLPESFRIHPMVLINTAIHVGFSINGVPIVDMPILQVFFSGYYSDTMMQVNRANRDVRRYPIYASADEAPRVLFDYLLSPPQMQTYVGGLRERVVDLPAVADVDRAWSQCIYESAPQ